MVNPPIGPPPRVTEIDVVGVKVTDVAVAVFLKANGDFLLSSRPEGKPYAGYWEFPGGKIEPSESVRDALIRELQEELNVTITACTPWFTFLMRYTHATVRLHTWRVTAWEGELHGLEGQSFDWQSLASLQAAQLTVGPALPGCVPIFRALKLPTTCLISNASEIGVEMYLQHLRAFWGKNASNTAPVIEFVSPFSGLRTIIQVRDKSLPPAERELLAREIVAIAQANNALVLINEDIELAVRVAADGVHLTSAQLQSLDTRPSCSLVGASVHSRAELDRAAELKCDFAVLGAVKATPTHPGQAGVGWAGFAQMVENAPIPVFALGGLTELDRGDAMAHGAHGVAMMRGWRA